MLSLALEGDVFLVLGVSSRALQSWGTGCTHSEEVVRVRESLRRMQTWRLAFSPSLREEVRVPGCGAEWKLESDLADAPSCSLSALLSREQLLFEEAFREWIMRCSCLFHPFIHLLSPRKSWIAFWKEEDCSCSSVLNMFSLSVYQQGRRSLPTDTHTMPLVTK